MKTICIYHSVDLDGWMSAAIVKYWFNQKEVPNKKGEPINTMDFIGWNYGDDIPDLSEYNKVIMCDISFPAEKMFELYTDYGTNFIWLDHHISAIKANLERLGADLITGITNDKFAACELTWKYFFPDESTPEIVRLLGLYDSFRHKETEEEQKVLEFQYGARQCISNYEDAYKYLELATNPKKGDATGIILENGQSIYKYLCTEAKATYKKAFPIKLEEENWFESNTIIGKMTDGSWKNRKFLCVNQERFNPINFGIDYHKDGYDGFACFWYKDGKWAFSLYNDNGEVDCSVIAKQYGGGGHKGASGMVLNHEQFLSLIK